MNIPESWEDKLINAFDYIEQARNAFPATGQSLDRAIELLDALYDQLERANRQMKDRADGFR